MTLGEFLYETGFTGVVMLLLTPIGAYQVIKWICEWLYPIGDK